MKLPFDDRFAPITSEIGFVEAPAEKVVDWFTRWDRSIQEARGVSVTSRAATGNFATLLQTLLPLTSVLPRRFLFVPTTGAWTAYFDNGHQGTDAATLSHVALQLGCRAVRAAAIPDSLGSVTDRSKKGRYGATILEVYGPEEMKFLNYVRTIAAANDGGRWVFEQSGEPFAFEDTKQYRTRVIKDRFPPSLLEKYLRELGISAFDEEFYAPLSTAFLVERTGGPAVPAMRDYSLAEAREGFADKLS